MTPYHGRMSVATAAAAATRAAYRELRRQPPVEARLWQRPHRAGRGVELYGGLAAAAGAAAAMGLAGGVAARTRAAAVGAALAAGLCAAYGDRRGPAHEHGLAAQLAALREGRLTSGGVRLLGIGATGLAAGALLKARPLDRLLAGTVIAGAAHTVNLFDGAPGRAATAVIAAGAPGLLRKGPGGVLAAASVGAAAACLGDGRAERTTLGGAGSHALGAALGAAVATANGRTGLVLHATLLVALTAAADRISTRGRLWNGAGMRHVDGWGRAAHPFG